MKKLRPYSGEISMSDNVTRSNAISSCIIALTLCAVLQPALFAQTSSLQDIGGASWRELPSITIYPAREVVTLDPEHRIAEAVAVVGDRILGTGDLETLKKQAGDQEFRIDNTFANKVIVPGFIAQHDHPVLTALTMASEVLAIEEWALPNKTIRAVKDKADFMKRLAAAEEKLEDPEEPLVSWGYHPNFYGELTREQLNEISNTRPVVVWARSCHEVILNAPALKAAGITKEMVDGWSESQQEQSNLEEGRFWEQGFFAALTTNLATMIATPEKLQAGLEIARDYMHSKGITFGNEPGGILVKPVQDGVNAVFSQPTMPFRWTFMVDGKTMCDKYSDDAQVLEESKKLSSWYEGMTSQSPMMAKLFADGAIYSQLMKLRDPYLDNHKGEWMTDLDVFQRAFRIYWDAGYQIHIHVNGDAGLDRVLDTLETNIRRNPRFDHRTTIVHFAVSAKDQVDGIKRLGCIVSGNPYYVRALADNYSKVGLGPERADQMVRMGDVERLGISFSYHSDMPMAPADPLFLMWCGVNRITTSGRVAAPDQRVSREAALRAVTLDAAYSLKMEDQIGSIVAGKLANFTILNDNPVTCDAEAIKDIAVWGTVHEGRVLPVSVPKEGRNSTVSRNERGTRMDFAHGFNSQSARTHEAEPHEHEHSHDTGCCGCAVNRALVSAMFQSPSDSRAASR